jgi:POT family proton-dependent oligopeptide transporter
MGLSMVTKLAPARLAGMMMDVWLLATSVGNKISGSINIFWGVWSHHTFYGVLTASCVVAALLIAIQLRRLSAAIPQEITNTPADTVLPPNLGRTLFRVKSNPRIK